MEGTVENISEEESPFYSIRKFTLIQGIGLLVAGLVLLVKPDWGLILLSVVTGVIILINGFHQIRAAFKSSSINKQWWKPLLWGLASSVIGILIIWNPLSLTKVVVGLPLIIGGIILILFGFASIFTNNSMSLPSVSKGHGIGQIVLGIIMISISPENTAAMIVRAVGLIITLAGIGLIIFSQRSKQKL